MRSEQDDTYDAELDQQVDRQQRYSDRFGKDEKQGKASRNALSSWSYAGLSPVSIAELQDRKIDCARPNFFALAARATGKSLPAGIPFQGTPEDCFFAFFQ